MSRARAKSLLEALNVYFQAKLKIFNPSSFKATKRFNEYEDPDSSHP